MSDDEQQAEPDYRVLWLTALDALRILGREVRALRERLAGES